MALSGRHLMAWHGMARLMVSCCMVERRLHSCEQLEDSSLCIGEETGCEGTLVSTYLQTYPNDVHKCGLVANRDCTSTLFLVMHYAGRVCISRRQPRSTKHKAPHGKTTYPLGIDKRPEHFPTLHHYHPQIVT